MAESFAQRRKRELGLTGKKDGEMSFAERRKIELGMVQPPEEPKRDLPTKLVLDDTLKSVMKPTAEPLKPIDFKTEVSKSQVTPKQESKLQGKLPAASLLNGDNNKPLQTSLNGKLPASSLITSTGGGPANADKIPGVSQYEINKKEIANDNAPKAIKAYANAMNYVTEGNPIGVAVGNAFSGNSGATLKDSSGNKTVDKITGAINNFVTPILTPTGAPLGQGIIGSSYDATGKALSGAAGQRLINTVSTGVPFAGKEAAKNITRVGITEGIAGAFQGAGLGVQQGDDSTKSILKNAAMGAAGGAVLGTAGAAIGEVASPLLRKLFKQNGLSDAEIAEIAPETLALPEGRGTVRQSAAADRSVLQSGTEPISTPHSDIKYEQQVINEYKALKSNPEVQLNNKQTYELARKNVDTQTPVNVITDTKPAAIPSRTEEINNRVLNGGELTQEDINVLLSDEYKPESLTQVGPDVKLSNTEPEVAATVEAPIKPAVTEVNKQEPKIQGERGFTQTLKASEKTPEELKVKLSNQYEPITNQDTVDKANARLAKDVEDATNMVLGTSKFDAEKSVTAQRLIDHYNKQGNYEMSVTIADKIATEATKAGQFIQSLSVYDRLTPEGVLIHAKRIANRVNETSSKIGKQAEVTPKMAEDIVSLAGVTQKMTGVKDLSNNVIDILERAKSGEKLNSADASALEKFVNESKQFIKETTKSEKPPKAPTAIKDKRVRDNVTSFLDAQEQAAKARLKAKGIRVSSTPLDIWADYAVIGAAKMGKNIIKFADWSEQMVKDLGEDIRPQLARLYQSSKEAFELTSKKISRQTISDAEKLTQKVIKTKELSADEAESLMNIAQRVSALSGEAKRTASQDLQAILQSLDKPSVLRKISSVQTQAQLLNPKTQVRNVFGNELFYRLERLNKTIATPIDIARSKLTGSARTVTFRSNNQGQYWYNFISGAKAGWKGVNINGLETQFDLASPAFTGKYNPLKYTEKALGASLRSFDNAAYSRAVNKSLGELGTLDAINKGVKPTKEYVQNFIAQADENIMQIADSYGKYVTFQDSNVISKGLTGLKKGLNVGKDFGFGDLVLKYPKTPGALLMRALEYSPAGFLRSAKIAVEPLLRNGIEKNPAEAVQALSRGIIGTFGLSMLGYFLMDKGILTGQASKDRDIRSLQSAAGQGQYQVNLSALYRFATDHFNPESAKIKEGDLLYNYDWMQPVSVAVSMGANINKNLNQDATGGKVAAGALGAAYNSISGGINTLTEQSVLQGLARAAEGSPGQTVTDKIADILSDVPASFIPTLFNQIKQATDNTKRETTDPTLLQQTFNKAQAKIPLLAGKLPKKYDTLGNEQKHYQKNSLANVFFNPGFPSRYTLSPEAKMIVNLITETGDEGVAPRVPNKKVDGTKLTGEQFSRLSQLQGEETKKLLGKVKPTLSTESKVKKVKKQLTKATGDSKDQLYKEFPYLKVGK